MSSQGNRGWLPWIGGTLFTAIVCPIIAGLIQNRIQSPTAAPGGPNPSAAHATDPTGPSRPSRDKSEDGSVAPDGRKTTIASDAEEFIK